MASKDGLGARVGRKFMLSRSSMDLPEHLKHGADVDEDVTKPRGENREQYMHQSIFSMVTAAGHHGKRRETFMSRFDEDPSESEEDAEGEKSSQSTQPMPTGDVGKGKSSNPDASNTSRRKSSVLRSLPRLDKIRPRKDRRQMSQDPMSSSQILPPRPRWEEDSDAEVSEPEPSSEAPVLSRMLTARAEMEASEPDLAVRKSKDQVDVGTSGVKSPTSLVEQLAQIFAFDEAEKVIAEYPCWLLQTVLLQGYMYVTQKHVCFYAYLPKKEATASKSGYLTKRRNRGPNPMWKRYWFQLRGDVLSYYTNQTEPYFPAGHVDLRYAISAKLMEGKDQTHFVIDAAKRVYRFRADSAVSAKEWVKNLQRVIFRSQNDGDSVKISIPIDNITDVDRTTALDFADTIKFQFIDSNESFVLDEYLFSFFSFGEEAYNVLKTLVNDNELHNHRDRKPPASPAPRVSDISSQPRAASGGRASMEPSDAAKHFVHDSVRATLRPATPTRRSSLRMSADSKGPGQEGGRLSFDRRQSFDSRAKSPHRGRSPGRSDSRHREQQASMSPQSSRPHASSDSFAPETESSGAVQSLDDTNASASQILEGSALFRPTTMRRYPRSSSRSSADNRRASQDTARSHEGPSATSATGRGRSNMQRSTAQSSSHTPYESVHAGAMPIKKQPAAAKPAYGLSGLVPSGSPLGLASNITEYMKKRSKDMSSLLASETMGYYEKVSGMWAGNRKHYGGSQALIPDDEYHEADDEEMAANDAARFRDHFGLPETEKLRAAYYAHVHRVLPLYGKIYISNKHFCFRPLIPGTRFTVVLPFTAIENASKERAYRPGYHAFMIVIRGFEELFFDFRRREDRDDCVVNLLQLLDQSRYMEESGLLSKEEESKAEAAKAEHQMLQQARQDGHAEHDIKLPGDAAVHGVQPNAPPVLFDDPRASILNFKPAEPLRITCLTIGSRGDVQPYIALCKGLLAEGHKPRIATHPEFGPWVQKYGIDFKPVAGDPAELMRICVENGMFTFSFLKEASAKFRGWIDELLTTAWEASQGSDLLIESPSAMGGIHIAEALQIPYFRAFSMPWTRTRAYPHAFVVPERKMGGYYNYMSYVMFDQIFWKAIAGQVNRWRRKELSLGSTNLHMMQPNKVPFLYSFSPSVVVPPLDYSDWIRVTGYWFLDEGGDWKPPKPLEDFIRKAREDKKKLVYVGFGSIVVENPAGLTRTVVEAVLKADVRCVLSKGWSDRLGKKDATKVEVPLPPEIIQIQSAPHDWLFRQMDAAAHHGGAGTTGASLRAGIPTIVKPFFGDQFFFGSRVEDLGVGICMKKVNTTLFSQALWHASHDDRMRKKAALLGEQIRKEDGVGNAIQAIYRDMEYAKTLIKQHKATTDGVADEPEETWTFVGDESDPELKRGIVDLDRCEQHQRGSFGARHDGSSVSGRDSEERVSRTSF